MLRKLHRRTSEVKMMELTATQLKSEEKTKETAVLEEQAEIKAVETTKLEAEKVRAYLCVIRTRVRTPPLPPLLVMLGLNVRPPFHTPALLVQIRVHRVTRRRCWWLRLWNSRSNIKSATGTQGRPSTIRIYSSPPP